MSKGYEQGIKNMYKYKYIHTLSRWEKFSSLLELQIKIIWYGLLLPIKWQKSKKTKYTALVKVRKNTHFDVLPVRIL